MTEAIQPSRTIVELGFGPRPFPSHGTRRLLPDEHYIGIDPIYWAWEIRPGDDPLHLSVERMISTNGDRSFELLRAGGENIPLESSSVDEVVVINVLSDPYVGIKERIKIMKDSVRVLKQDGKLITMELITPSLFTAAQARAYLEGMGMTQLNRDDEQDEEEMLKYSSFAAAKKEGSYIAVFGKVGVTAQV